MKRFLFSLLMITMLFGLSSCSTTGSGSKDGLEDGLSESDLDSQLDSRFGDAGIPRAEGEGLLRDINFEYDSAAITSQGMADVEYNKTVLDANPDVSVQLEGHCDERGTAEYNLALGASRAKAVKEALISMGVSPSKLGTISYGEEIPLDPSSNEAAWAKNRRVHFSPYRGERKD